jgi:hypothetical protein
MLDTCDICSNAKYIYSRDCFEDCAAFDDTVAKGTTSFGRTCVQGTFCEDGQFEGSRETCSCASDCGRCLWPEDGGDTLCTRCVNGKFLYDGTCYEDCDSFPGTRPAGRGPEGQECVQ